MAINQTVEKLKVPKDLNAPWLTAKYVANNGWYPVCDEWLQNPEASHSPIPWKSRSEFRPGDIIIFDEYEERTLNGKYDTDRFMVVGKEDIEEYERGERGLLPCGVVVHPPERPRPKLRLIKGLVQDFKAD